MKTCHNCRSVYADEYGGQCKDCGAPMGGVQGSNQGDLGFRYAAQLGQGRREADMEQSFRSARGNARPGDAFDRAPIDERVFDVARSLIVQVKPLPEDTDA